MAGTKLFDEAYKTLNAAQKKAVDTVEGPVLVIAGPGTGKTHILTLRIANILKVTQATPASILVLTFTESAARTVRTRLAELIGEETARDVFISTFHGFCEYVLKEYADYFPSWAGKRLLGDVEAALLWREVLETEDLVHLRTPKSPYHYLKDLQSLYNGLVRENFTLDSYRAWAGEEAKRIQTDESLRYLRDSKHGAKGEMKPDGHKKLERLEKVYEAARVMEAYEALKDSRDVYDFSDVLSTVVAAVETDDALRARLQEQYLYVLADEHQDANATQHALLDALAYDEHPNLFVVGDEKQAIFRFQGADGAQFAEFVAKYPRTVVITLDESFRSLQELLDSAHGIANAHLPNPENPHKPLRATRKGSAALSLLVSPDPLAERDQVAALVEAAIAGGTAPEEIAVITSKNATASAFAEHLAGRGVPTLRAGDVYLSSRPVLRALLALMRTVADPLDTSAYREMLLAPWWPIELKERAELLRKTRDRDLPATLKLLDEELAATISKLQTAALDTAPLLLFSKLLAESGARDYLLSHAEHVEEVTLVRKLWMHIEEVVARNREVSFAEAVDALTKAHEHGLESVKSSVLKRAGHVTVITVHKAKGMEFEKVFVVALTAQEWEKGGRAATIPSPIDSARTLDDVARQFYVAITRAKDELTLSYAAETADGRERPPSVLVPSGLPQITPAYDPLPILHTTVRAPDLVRALTLQYLTEDGLSPSALAEYLDSPASFFARRVLRLSEPETPAITIGVSVHAGIAEYLKSENEDTALAALEGCLAQSTLPRTAAFEQSATDARRRLHAYLLSAKTHLPVVATEKTYTTSREIAGTSIQLTGKVDAVFEVASGERITDFKTSTQVRGHEEQYELQLAFYDFLLRANGHAPTEACITQVLADEVVEHAVPLNEETRAQFLETLDAVSAELLTGEWREGKASDYDSLLKLFTD